jgi:uncharacterized UPF0160 family protein
MNIDVNQVYAILGIVGTVLGAISVRLAMKWQIAVAATKEFVTAAGKMNDMYKAANADNHVTQEEYNQLIEQVMPVYQKAVDAVKAGEDLYAELKVASAQLMAIVNAKAETDKAEAAVSKKGGK